MRNKAVGLMSLMAAAAIQAAANNVGGNSVTLTNNKSFDLGRPTIPKLPRMSRADFSRAKAKCGHLKRNKNKAKCAAKAKLRRRRSA